MDANYLEIANGVGMWLVCSVAVAIAMFQAFIFMRRAFATGKKIGLSDKQLMTGFRAGAITSIGPSFAVLVGLVGLIAIIGAPVAWMRESIIGAVMFEALAAQYGADAMGVKVGTSGYGLVAYANSLWVQALGSVGWLLVVGLFTHKLDDLRRAVVRGREELLPIISTGAILGAFGFQVSKNLIKITPATTAAVVGGLAVIIINTIANRAKAAWLKEWSLGIAMLLGMFASTL